MAGQGEKLKGRQQQAITALLSEGTVKRAAKKAGVGERTLRRWLSEDKAFLAEYRAARRVLLEQTLTNLATISSAAVVTLYNEFRADSPAVRVRAASNVLRLLFSGHELTDIEERLEALESEVSDDE